MIYCYETIFTQVKKYVDIFTCIIFVVILQMIYKENSKKNHN